MSKPMVHALVRQKFWACLNLFSHQHPRLAAMRAQTALRSMLITDREGTDHSAWEAKNRRAFSVGDQATHQRAVQSAFPGTLGLENHRPAFTILPSLRSPGLVPHGEIRRIRNHSSRPYWANIGPTS